MAAEPEQQGGTGADAGVQVETLHASTAAFALTVFIHRDDDDRTARLFHQTGGHDADDARVPVAAPEQDDPVFEDGRLLVQLLLRRLDDLLFRLLPGDVDLIQSMRQLFGALFVLAENELQRRHRAIHPACGIDARRDGIADIFGGDGLSGQTDLVQQGDETRPVRSAQLLQTGLDEGAVFSGQRHDVRHRADSSQVAAVFQHFLGRTAVQCRAELKRHACTAQTLEGAVVVFPARVDDRHRLRQCLRRKVVVGDDQIDAQRSRKRRFLDRRDAVIHGHDELIALVVDGLDGVLGQTVAVALPAGEHTLDVRAHSFQVLIEQCRCGHAVHIVIAENDDGFLIVDGVHDALTGFVHVGQQHRVAQLFLTGQQHQRLGRVSDASCRQNTGQKSGLFLLSGKGRIEFFFTPRLVGVVFHFLSVLLGDGPGQLPYRRTVEVFQFPCPAGHCNPSPVNPSFAIMP